MKLNTLLRPYTDTYACVVLRIFLYDEQAEEKTMIK
jgi:hypothetical protein